MRNELLISKFEFILDSITLIQVWFSEIKMPDDYLSSTTGKSHFNATLMRLQSIGETIKKINSKYPQLLEKHNQIEWHEIIRLREIISHHYEQLSHEVIFGICQKNIPELKSTVEFIISELKRS